MTPYQNQWIDCIDRFKNSGLSMAEFARKEKLDIGQLKWWNGHRDWILQKQKRRMESNELSFIELDIPKTAKTIENIEVILANGRTVRLPTNIDTSTAHRILAIVEGAT